MAWGVSACGAVPSRTLPTRRAHGLMPSWECLAHAKPPLESWLSGTAIPQCCLIDGNDDRWSGHLCDVGGIRALIVAMAGVSALSSLVTHGATC